MKLLAWIKSVINDCVNSRKGGEKSIIVNALAFTIGPSFFNLSNYLGSQGFQPHNHIDLIINTCLSGLLKAI